MEHLKHRKFFNRSKRIFLVILLIFLLVIVLGVYIENLRLKNMKQYVVFQTTKGNIKAELYVKEAPITTKNFIGLVDSGFYNGLTFHRYEPGFVIQGGDPKGDGTGGSSKTIPLEINENLTHIQGALAMARSNDPNSASSQFYITLDEAHFLDGNYAVFGKVISGMVVVDSLRVGDKINNAFISDK